VRDPEREGRSEGDIQTDRPSPTPPVNGRGV
jgi:hypothetical protein